MAPATADSPRMEWGAAEAAPQRETQRRLFGSLAPQATGNGTSAVHPPGVGPRLEAFNMAKSGAPRDEVARHLKEKFGLRIRRRSSTTPSSVPAARPQPQPSNALGAAAEIRDRLPGALRVLAPAKPRGAGCRQMY